MPPKKTLPIIEVEDNEFDELISEGQHKESLGVMKQVLSAIKEETEKEKRIAELIQKSNGNFELFLQKLKAVQTPQISINNAATEKKLQEILDCQLVTNVLLQQLIDLRGMDVEMIPTRSDFNSPITKVTVKTVFPKNSKYTA